MTKTTQNETLFSSTRSRNIWISLIVIRFLLTTLGQRGYIHPDEFFQGPEVLAGDLFNCRDRILRTWEFGINQAATTKNESMEQLPIRNIAMPAIFYALPLAALKTLSSLTGGLIKVNTATLIYYPRLFMTTCSLLVDLCVFKLANKLFVSDYDSSPRISSSLIMIASSHLSLVFLTRTFSNSIETFLFAILNYLVVRSLLLNKSERLLDRHNDGKLIGLVVCLGIFNRPTFMIFAFVPLLYWTLGLTDNQPAANNTLKQHLGSIMYRAANLSSYFMPASVILILIDTVYFFELKSIDQLVEHLLTKQSPLMLTPFNFLNYNSNAANLAQHGSHPVWLHVLNCFLLFGPGFFLLVVVALKHATSRLTTASGPTTKTTNPSSSSSISTKFTSYFLFSFVVPLLVFSLVDHKEARFLLPLVLPVCVLTSHLVFGPRSYRLVRVAWFVFNISATVVFGYLHQGGLISAISYTQRMFTHTSNLEIDQHVVFSHTYMPPRYLIEAPLAFNLIDNRKFEAELKRLNAQDMDNDSGRSKTEYSMPKRSIYDLMSSSRPTDLSKLVYSIRDLYVNPANRFVDTNYAIFLVAPQVAESELRSSSEFVLLDDDDDQTTSSSHAASSSKDSIVLRRVEKFYFHVTFEHLQDHIDYLLCDKDMGLNRYGDGESVLIRAIDSFSLNLYQIVV